MRRLNAYSIRVGARPDKLFPLSCPLSELSGEIHVKRLSTMDVLAAGELAGTYIAKHITGSGRPIEDGPDQGKPDPSDPNFVPPVPIGAVDGQPITLSTRTVVTLASIELAQVGDDPYRFDELAAMAMSDHIAEQLLMIYEWIQPNLDKPPAGNSPDGSGQESTPTPSEDFTTSQS